MIDDFWTGLQMNETEGRSSYAIDVMHPGTLLEGIMECVKTFSNFSPGHALLNNDVILTVIK